MRDWLLEVGLGTLLVGIALAFSVWLGVPVAWSLAPLIPFVASEVEFGRGNVIEAFLLALALTLGGFGVVLLWG